MTAYRFYVVNPEGHVAAPPQIVECADDQEAIRQTQQRLNSEAIEIWDGSRLVGRFEPENKTA